MNENPANPTDKIIKEFFENLKIENSYYSMLLKQPILLIGEKNLHQALKQAILNTNSKI